MRQILVLCMMVLALSSEVLARRTDWHKVEKLKAGTLVQVDLWRGPTVDGKIQWANGTKLQLTLWDGTPVEAISRDDIRRIVRIRGPRIRDPYKVLMISTGIGAVSGAMLVAVRDKNDCQGCKGFRVVMGGVAGGVLGFLGGAVVEVPLGIIGMLHHSSVIYVSERTPK